MNKDIEEYTKKCGNFHTQANLAQALLDILTQHHSQMPDGMKTIPSFIKIPINNICSSLACAINGDIYNTETWNQISTQANLVSYIIIQAHEKAKQEIEKTQEENKENGNT